MQTAQLSNMHMPTRYLFPAEVVDRGWRVLVKELGADNAIRFLQTFSAGTGDSVEEYRSVWGNKSIDEIHEKILQMKKGKNI